MKFLLTASPEDSSSFTDSAMFFTSSGSSANALSPDPLEGMSEDSVDLVVWEVSVDSDNSSSSGLNILGISLLLEYSRI